MNLSCEILLALPDVSLGGGKVFKLLNINVTIKSHSRNPASGN